MHTLCHPIPGPPTPTSLVFPIFLCLLCVSVSRSSAYAAMEALKTMTRKCDLLDAQSGKWETGKFASGSLGVGVAWPGLGRHLALAT